MWLMPAQVKATVAGSSPRYRMSWSNVPWTLWHRPTAGTSLVRVTVCMFMDMGLL